MEFKIHIDPMVMDRIREQLDALDVIYPACKEAELSKYEICSMMLFFSDPNVINYFSPWLEIMRRQLEEKEIRLRRILYGYYA